MMKNLRITSQDIPPPQRTRMRSANRDTLYHAALKRKIQIIPDSNAYVAAMLICNQKSWAARAVNQI